jgi:hypothetical protein
MSHFPCPSSFQLLFRSLQLLQIMLAAAILNSPSGYVTPHRLVNVPEVRVPMRIWSPTEVKQGLFP